VADEKATLRVVDELLWVLRRSGFAIATSQAIDVARALRATGFASKTQVRDAVACVVVTRHADRERFDAAFDGFFARARRMTLWERLLAEGFTESDVATVRELLAAQQTLGQAEFVVRGPELDRLFQLATSRRLLEGMQSALQLGFYTHRLLDQLGANRPQGEEMRLRRLFEGAFGPERAEALARIFASESRAVTDEVRAFVRSTLEERERTPRPHGVLDQPLASLDASEVEEVRKAVRRFVERLRGGERVRRRRASRGRIDLRATLAASMRTGGVPLRLVRRRRRRDKPCLMLLCDVSDSVRSVARFLLELTHAAQDLFARTRSFVFVGELGETTKLFSRESIDASLAAAYSGAVVSIADNSNYGRVLRAFEERVLRDVDRLTTVVILGDGRTNYQEDAADVLDKIRARARTLVWLCPESRATWAIGDSAMPRYARKCTRVLSVRTARDLEEASRLLVTR
jgi:uncharacterized protein with von Willebrand factor type A (vWA) domain